MKLPQSVGIHQEIDLCRRFVMLESVRLGDRLHVEWIIQTMDESIEILNLLLQPLLENAIYHGVQPLPEGGVVHVEIKQVERDVLIKITNPYRLQAPKASDELSSGNGMAVDNIRSRLQAFYGSEAYLRVIKDDREFCVLLRYPAKSL